MTPPLNYFLMLTADYVYWERDVCVMPSYYLFWRPGVFNFGICTKYEPYVKLHRVHILYITCGFTPHLNYFGLLSADYVHLERDVSIMLSYYLFCRPGVFILGICTKYEPCAKLHRIRILYITRGFHDTTFKLFLLLSTDYVFWERDVSIMLSYYLFWRPGVFILGICTKYEPCAKLHRIRILYITRGFHDTTFKLFLLLSTDYVFWERDVSIMLSYYLFWRPGVFNLGICIKYEPCAKLHRVHILYITRGFTPHFNYFLLLSADYVTFL